MKKKSIILSLVVLTSCIKSTPLFFKTMKTADYEIQWYYYSYLSNESPNYIKVINKDSSVIICESENIFDVNIINEDSIIILFNPGPRLVGQNPKILSSVFGINIHVDSINQPNLKRKNIFK